MTEMERMLAGRLYIAQGEEIASAFLRCRGLTDAFNRAAYDDFEGRNAILRELFGALGEGASIAPPFRCDYGRNIFIGDRFMANYDCIMLDVCRITIGDDVFFGPRVGLYTAAHPLDAAVRAEGLEYGRPIAIGNGVWLGGNVVVNPGAVSYTHLAVERNRARRLRGLARKAGDLRPMPLLRQLPCLRL